MVWLRIEVHAAGTQGAVVVYVDDNAGRERRLELERAEALELIGELLLI